MVSNYFQKAVSEVKPETEIFVKHYLDITTCILNLMEERGMTQKDLADALNKNASEINRWFKSDHNLTLKTLSKIEALFGVSIIEVYSPSTFAEKSTAKRTRLTAMDTKQQSVKEVENLVA
jgi:transcriptional regulator with XRE-family HTH domain